MNKRIRIYTAEQKERRKLINSQKWRSMTDEDKRERNERNKKWFRENPEKTKLLLEKHKKVRQETSRKWQRENKKRASINHVNWVKNNHMARLSSNIRNLIRSCFKGKKSKRTEEILGCSIIEFREYLFSFYADRRLTAADFGKTGYHIDHKIPISTATNDEEVIRLCHYTNLQPLYWRDNIIKSNKII